MTSPSRLLASLAGIVVTLAAGVGLSWLAAGCDDSGQLLDVEPGTITMGPSISTSVLAVVSGTQDQSLPLEWNVTDPNLGQIVRNSDYSAIYFRTANNGLNIVVVSDQLGAQGFASVNQVDYDRDSLTPSGTTNATTLSYVTVSGATEVAGSGGAQYTCTAYYSSGSPVNVSDSASWSENSAYASISTNGYLTTAAVSSNQPCQITATYGGKSDSYDITITSASTLSHVTVSGAAEVGTNSGSQYLCTAYYSDSSSLNVSSNSGTSWSENCAYASISTSGYLTTTAVSSNLPCQIAATYGGKSDSYDITIKP